MRTQGCYHLLPYNLKRIELWQRIVLLALNQGYLLNVLFFLIHRFYVLTMITSLLKQFSSSFSYLCAYLLFVFIACIQCFGFSWDDKTWWLFNNSSDEGRILVSWTGSWAYGYSGKQWLPSREYFFDKNIILCINFLALS